jgi:hypothetical protein
MSTPWVTSIHAGEAGRHGSGSTIFPFSHGDIVLADISRPPAGAAVSRDLAGMRLVAGSDPSHVPIPMKPPV